ncbi:MAG: ribosome maturation factor RimM [Gemmatimonadota bacterium]
MTPPTHVAIGRIVQAHGLKGELTVFPLSPEADRFAAGAVVGLTPDAEGQGGIRTVPIAGSRPHGGKWLLRFDGVADRTTAEAYKGWYLLIPYPEAEAARAPDEFFLHTLVGRTARTPEGRDLGAIIDVLETGHVPLLEIATPDGPRRLLPFVKEFVDAVEDAEVIVTPPAGWDEV